MPELERFSYSTDIVEKYKNWFADADILKHLYPNTPFISNPSEKVSVEEWCEWMASLPYAYLITLDEKAIGHIAIYVKDENRSIGCIGIVIGEKVLLAMLLIHCWK